jgi:hypothetical protein
MSWMPGLGWGAWLALGFAPLAILALYFLKIRRPVVQVPSTMLWTRTIEDFNANSLWQRFRHQLLLYLQLAAVGLMILAALRPGCRGTDLGGDRFVLLIDNSASMAATDVRPSRLARAKQEAERIIDNMKSRDTAMVIAFSDVASVEQSYTTNKWQLKNAVARIEQSDRYTNLSEALKLATGLSNVGQTSDRESKIDIQVAESLEATAFVLSDGGFGRLPDVLLGKLRLEYRPIGEKQSTRNVGIVGCQLAAAPDLNGPIKLFVRIENFAAADQNVDVSVEVNDRLCDAQKDVKVAAESSTSIILDVAPFVDASGLPAVVQVSIGPEDDFDKDNVALALIGPGEKIKLAVVSAAPDLFQNVLSTSKVLEGADVVFQAPAWLESEDYRQQVSARQLDAIIFDQCSPQEPPRCNAIYFDRIPPSNGWTQSDPQFPAPIVFVSRFHPLVANLSFADVLILEARKVTGPPGSTPLVESNFGPLAMIGPRGEFEDLVIGFPLRKANSAGEVESITNWPTRPSFPTFFYNLLAYQLRRGPQRGNEPIAPGQPIQLSTKLVAADDIVIERPDGNKIALPAGNAGQVTFTETDKLGLYRQVDGAVTRPTFVVNLMRSEESSIQPRESIDVSYQLVAGTPAGRSVQRDFWPWLVLLVLVVVGLEWYVFIRRIKA